MNASFPATRWSVVVAAGDRCSAALESLCRDYWLPLYAFARAQGRQAADAEDAVQSFFCQLLANDGVARAERGRGRFRTYLLTCFRNHLADAHDHDTAAKRDARRLAWLDAHDAEARLALEPAVAGDDAAGFDRAWALRLLALVESDLAAEYATDDRQRLFTAARPFLAGAVEPAIAPLAAELGLSTGATKVALHRLRSRWRELLRLRIADTVADVQDIDDELRHLAAAVGGAQESGNRPTDLP